PPVEGGAEVAERRASADGEAPRKKKKKRPPVEGGAEVAERRVSADGEAPRKKKKKRPPVEGSAEVAERRASADGEAPRKKKKKRPPVEGSAEVAERRASANGEAPRKKKKKRPPVEGGAEVAERRASADGEVPRKKKRPAVEAAPERRTVSAKARSARTAQTRSAGPLHDAVSAYAERAKTALASHTAAAKEELRTGIRPVSIGMFVIAVVLYIVIASIIINVIAGKAKGYLLEYELSCPKYTIDSYMETISDSFLADMMTQAAAGLDFNEYEQPELLYDFVRSQAESAGEYTYQRAEDYTNARPDYYVLRDGEAVAKVALARTGWTEQYNFPLWRVDDPVSVIALQATPEFTLNVTMPAGAFLSVNGVDVPEENYLEVESDFQLSQAERLFMAQPMARQCVISGLYCPPKITVTDAEGNVLEPYETPAPDHADQTYVFPIADTKEPDQGLVDRVTALTYAYMDYVINTRCELDANLANLSGYLLPGSPVSNLMYTISSDIWYNNDPNMREDHVFEIRHVKMYAENVCTVDVHLETTLGKVAVNDYIGTVRWVLVNNGFGWYATNFSLHP
ncbi:MAG: hypothetical protein IJM46_06940, partial [Oscillospiraceae bacterium]|nr:hypothetical protein [Oscillospiraceae bacterium]